MPFQTSAARLRSGHILVPVALTLTLVSVSLSIASWATGRPHHTIPDKDFTFVVRGAMEQSLVQTGSIESKSQNFLINQCEWSTSIVDIIEEGTWVEPGDIVAVLDSSELRERFMSREVKTVNAAAAYKQAQEDLKIQQLTNASKIAAAKLKLELAQLELTGYSDAEYAQQLHQLQGKVTLAKEAVSRAIESADFVLSMYRRGYRTYNDFENEQISLLKARNELQTAQAKLENFNNHSHVRKLTQLTAAATEAERNLERVQIAARSAELNQEVRVSSRQKSYEVYMAEQEKLQRAIEACTIRATKAGHVVLARESSSSPTGIEQGSSVRYRQPIACVPDRDHLQVVMRIHESKFSSVQAGQPASIEITALENGYFLAQISHISRVSVPGQYPNYHLREFEVTVDLAVDPAVAREIAPGLSAKVTISVDQRSDALRVPIQSVVEIAGDYYTFVREGNTVMERPVEIGMTNETQVEILTGLTEGDEVVAQPRVTCAGDIARLQDLGTPVTNGKWLALLD